MALTLERPPAAAKVTPIKKLAEMTAEEFLHHTKALAEMAPPTGPIGRVQRPLMEFEEKVLEAAKNHLATKGYCDVTQLADEHGKGKREITRTLTFLRHRNLLPPATTRKVLPKEARREVDESHPLYRDHLKLAYKLAKFYAETNPDINKTVIKSAAVAALMRAAELYDERSGNRFSTYAWNCIEPSIWTAIRNERAPNHSRLEGENSGVSPKVAKKIARAYHENADGGAFGAKEAVGALLQLHREGTLPEKHLLTFVLKNLHGLTLDQTKYVLGLNVTREWMRQINKKATHIIREHIRPEGKALREAA